jgi:uncharacterized membrane protein YidH (DUF202 family)
MSNTSNTPETQNNGKAARVLLLGLAILCLVLAALDFIIHRHAYSELEGQPLFFAIFGGIAVFLVLGGAHILRKFVARKADYYQTGEDHE